jgi:5-methylcytosine-specific restriction endonuclease McrA
MPTKPENRNYKREYAQESESRKQDRRDRMNARYAYEKRHGDLPASTHVDHKRPLSQGGSNATSNLRAIPKAQNESFRRDGPGGNQIGPARKRR